MTNIIIVLLLLSVTVAILSNTADERSNWKLLLDANCHMAEFGLKMLRWGLLSFIVAYMAFKGLQTAAPPKSYTAELRTK